MMISRKAVGERKADIILFVHGAWHGAWCWERYFMPFFAELGYDNYALTLRGHEKPGRVKGINKISFPNYIEDLVQAVNQLDREPIIIGHSMGGLILQKYLEKHTCKKAIFLAAAPQSGLLRLSLFLFVSTSYSIASAFLMDLYRSVDRIDKVKWSFFSEDVPQEDLAFCNENICAESFLAYMYMMLPRVKIRANLGVPTLVVGGEADRLFTIKEQKAIAKAYKSDLVLIPEIAHDMMLDTKWKMAAMAIQKWLEQVAKVA